MDKTLVLDGASGTLLEKYGVTLHPTLWSAMALVDNQDAVRKMHKDYFDAGANVASTVTYQASFAGFEGHLSPQEIQKYMANAVKLAREAAEQSTGTQPKYVAAALGPYGSYLCQGQEYTGEYGDVTDETLEKFHAPRIAAMLAGEPDFLLLETIPTVQELRVLAKLVADVKIPVWIAFSIKFGQRVTLADGTTIPEAIKHCANFTVVGANCYPLINTATLLEQFSKHTDKPLIVYPNSGEVYDAEAKIWQSTQASQTSQWEVPEWQQLGARVIGGCCRSDPSHIAAVAKAL